MSQVRRAFYFQLGGLCLAAVVVAWLSHRYPVIDYVVRLQKAIGARGAWGAALYPLLYAACNVLLLPGGVLAVGSGLFFGLWWGFAVNLAGNVTGAACAFLLSRNLGRRWI